MTRGSLALSIMEESHHRAGGGAGDRPGRGGLQLHQHVVDHDDSGKRLVDHGERLPADPDRPLIHAATPR